MAFTSTSVDDTATYTCNMGFELIGSTSVTCTPIDESSAAFLPAAPVCRRECCILKTTDIYIIMYILVCVHSCSAALCPNPADIVNGVVTFTGNSVGGDTANYTCTSGFELIGNASITCTQVDDASAAFSPVPPVCRRKCYILITSYHFIFNMLYTSLLLYSTVF